MIVEYKARARVAMPTCANGLHHVLVLKIVFHRYGSRSSGSEGEGTLAAKRIRHYLVPSRNARAHCASLCECVKVGEMGHHLAARVIEVHFRQVNEPTARTGRRLQLWIVLRDNLPILRECCDKIAGRVPQGGRCTG